MPIETIIWFPYWYQCDQTIAVGRIGNFDFFKNAPDYVPHNGRRVFYHGDWQEKCRDLFDRQRMCIRSIAHPVLGVIRAIETNGLDYTFVFADGQPLKVEAEETPGLIYGRGEVISDWRIYVEAEPA